MLPGTKIYFIHQIMRSLSCHYFFIILKTIQFHNAGSYKLGRHELALNARKYLHYFCCNGRAIMNHIDQNRDVDAFGFSCKNNRELMNLGRLPGFLAKNTRPGVRSSLLKQ